MHFRSRFLIRSGLSNGLYITASHKAKISEEAWLVPYLQAAKTLLRPEGLLALFDLVSAVFPLTLYLAAM